MKDQDSTQEITIKTYEEDKNKKGKYGKNRYHNMSEEKKQKLKGYQKRRYQKAKNSFLIMI